MSCILNPAFWVYLICMIGFIMIIRLVVPWFVFLFGLLSCLFSGGGIGGALTFPHGR